MDIYGHYRNGNDRLLRILVEVVRASEMNSGQVVPICWKATKANKSKQWVKNY